MTDMTMMIENGLLGCSKKNKRFVLTKKKKQEVLVSSIGPRCQAYQCFHTTLKLLKFSFDCKFNLPTVRSIKPNQNTKIVSAFKDK